eukprot:TRINITY_DN779926_c0_g1_i1.p1 TRINITY_DN779926_c0_g1~~TRINITY_DN779926_c0_g1_i1.p1  ORF type:complete len:263 (+),score=66.15 TRINITY_DN779926_c0_g1_i1:60-848(+)
MNMNEFSQTSLKHARLYELEHLCSGDRCSTPYGEGVVHSWNGTHYKIALDWNSSTFAYFTEDLVMKLYSTTPYRMATPVETPFGRGTVKYFRRCDCMYIIEMTDWILNNGEHAISILKPSQVKRSQKIGINSRVMTEYGPAIVEDVRESDGMYCLHFSWCEHGAKGYFHHTSIIQTIHAVTNEFVKIKETSETVVVEGVHLEENGDGEEIEVLDVLTEAGDMKTLPARKVFASKIPLPENLHSPVAMPVFSMVNIDMPILLL